MMKTTEEATIMAKTIVVTTTPQQTTTMMTGRTKTDAALSLIDDHSVSIAVHFFFTINPRLFILLYCFFFSLMELLCAFFLIFFFRSIWSLLSTSMSLSL